MRSQKGRRLAGKFLSPNDFLRMRQPQAGDAGLGNEVLRYEAFIKDFGRQFRHGPASSPTLLADAGHSGAFQGRVVDGVEAVR